MAADHGLDDALDALYGVPPGEFVAVRKQLAGELRSAGDKDAAKELAKARRPTTAAWALNQLARRSPELIEELIERSDEVRVVQSKASSGAADELRSVSAARREALTAAADAAVTVAGDVTANPEAHRDAMAATLESASVDETLGTALREGRLVREAGGPVGFPEIATLRVVRGGKQPAPAAKGRGGPAKAREPEPEPVDDAAQAALGHAETEARRAKRAASEAALAAETAEQRLEDAHQAVDAAKEELAAAQAGAREARAEVKRRDKAVAAAENAVEAAQRRLAGR
jgi:hypothetical protein